MEHSFEASARTDVWLRRRVGEHSFVSGVNVSLVALHSGKTGVIWTYTRVSV